MPASPPSEPARIWLVGAKGMLASALGEELAALGLSWFATDLELDIGELDPVVAYARQHRPNLIINAGGVEILGNSVSSPISITGSVSHLAVNLDGPGEGWIAAGAVTSAEGS